MCKIRVKQDRETRRFVIEFLPQKDSENEEENGVVGLRQLEEVHHCVSNYLYC